MWFFETLRTVNDPKLSEDNKRLIDSKGREYKCLRIFREYRIFSHRQWHGNGFGYTSYMYVANTKTGVVKALTHHSLKEVSRIFKSWLEELSETEE
jgi:hypothetical protein